VKTSLRSVSPPPAASSCACAMHAAATRYGIAGAKSRSALLLRFIVFPRCWPRGTGCRRRLAVADRGVLRQASGGEYREQRDAREYQERVLERAESRSLVDAHRLVHLLRRGGGSAQDVLEVRVGDEVDVVEIDL